jgi:hypothetical protein
VHLQLAFIKMFLRWSRQQGFLYIHVHPSRVHIVVYCGCRSWIDGGRPNAAAGMVDYGLAAAAWNAL